jgi:hypothetical protein
MRIDMFDFPQWQPVYMGENYEDAVAFAKILRMP